MQYCQNLKPNDRENQNKLIQRTSNPNVDPEVFGDAASQNKFVNALRNGKQTENEGKRLMRKREAWEERIGMGQLTPEESFKVKETQKIRRDYLKELMLNEVNKNGLRFRAKFLNRHKVSSEVRVRMVSGYTGS
jgi:hypothetical protein